MQTIIGIGGVIANNLAKELKNYTNDIRLVSRNPFKINESDEIVAANMTNPRQADTAIAGSSVVYLTLGLQYKTSVWQEYWPKIMSNVIQSCKQYNSKLVFFDNVYMYGLVKGKMTEETPVNPNSKKGEVRAKITEQLKSEFIAGNLTAQIVRAADFYGPNANNTFIQPMVFDKLKNGKSAYWLVNPLVNHSFTYTPDAAKAVALLGNTDEAYNQIWHLPTHNEVMTGEEIIKTVAGICKVKPKYSILSKRMLKLSGLFMPLVKESIEMLYQYEYEYLFDSSKFEAKFFKPTPYIEGIRKTLYNF